MKCEIKGITNLSPPTVERRTAESNFECRSAAASSASCFDVCITTFTSVLHFLLGELLLVVEHPITNAPKLTRDQFREY